MVSLEVVAIMLSGLSISASLIYYSSTLANANKTQIMQLENRQVQLFMQAFNRFQDPSFLNLYLEVKKREWTSVEDYVEKYGEHDDALLSVQTYFEGIGVLLMKDMISADFVYELMPTMVNSLWEMYAPLIQYVRETGNYPQFWRPIEYLKDKMIEVGNKRGDPILLNYITE